MENTKGKDPDYLTDSDTFEKLQEEDKEKIKELKRKKQKILQSLKRLRKGE